MAKFVYSIENMMCRIEKVYIWKTAQEWNNIKVKFSNK